MSAGSSRSEHAPAAGRPLAPYGISFPRRASYGASAFLVCVCRSPAARPGPAPQRRSPDEAAGQWCRFSRGPGTCTITDRTEYQLGKLVCLEPVGALAWGNGWAVTSSTPGAFTVIPRWSPLDLVRLWCSSGNGHSTPPSTIRVDDA